MTHESRNGEGRTPGNEGNSGREPEHDEGRAWSREEMDEAEPLPMPELTGDEGGTPGDEGEDNTPRRDP